MSSASQLLYQETQGRFLTPGGDIKRPPVEFVEQVNHSWTSSSDTITVTTPKDPTITTTFLVYRYRHNLTIPSGWTLIDNQSIAGGGLVGLALLSYPGISSDVTLTQDASGTMAGMALGYRSSAGLVLADVNKRYEFLGTSGGTINNTLKSDSSPSPRSGQQLYIVSGLYFNTGISSDPMPTNTSIYPDLFYDYSGKFIGGGRANNNSAGSTISFDFAIEGDYGFLTASLY